MSEFNDRNAAQRRVLQIVNKKKWKEDLFGLSTRAIERWRTANHINHESPLSVLLVNASSKLSCLAAKSQEQISAEYEHLSDEISTITSAIEQQVRLG